jgi:hypothetical protein
MIFEKLLKELKKSGLQVTVKRFDSGEVRVLCGWNYPDEMYFNVSDIAEEVGIKVRISAESSGGVFEEFVINGGYRRH